jgi:hypothetical protein
MNSIAEDSLLSRREELASIFLRESELIGKLINDWPDTHFTLRAGYKYGQHQRLIIRDGHLAPKAKQRNDQVSRSSWTRQFLTSPSGRIGRLFAPHNLRENGHISVHLGQVFACSS